MVGVAGRSKGCGTCRQRKIACSLERPTCGQCVKSKRVCTGYQRDRVFIVSQATVDEHALPSGLGICHNGVPTTTTVPKRLESVTPLGNLKPRRPDVYCCAALQLTLAKSAPLHAAFRQQLLAAFLHSYLPDAFLIPHRPGTTAETPWLVQITETTILTKALDTSLLALCTAQLGRLHDDPVLIEMGLRSYTQSLRELQKALWDPGLMYHDETLAACLLLSMYEVLECPAKSPRAWTNHFDGCTRLVQLRGADAHSTVMGHQIFSSFRITAINEAVKVKRPTFFADPEWLTVPWKDRPKTPSDEVVDISAVLANIFVQSSDPKTICQLHELSRYIDHCWKLEGELLQFWTKFNEMYRGTLYWSEFSRDDNATDSEEFGKVFPVAFHYPNLRIAHTCVIYWSTLILLWATLAQLYQLPGLLTAAQTTDHGSTSSSSTSSSDVSSPAQPDSRFAALTVSTVAAERNICQSLEYYMLDEMKAIGPQASIIPLLAVIDTLPAFPDCARELEWAKAAFEKIVGKGLQLMRFVNVEE